MPAASAMGASLSPSSPLSHLYYFYCGLYDVFRLPSIIIFFFTSPAVRLRTAQCFILNGLVFLGSIFFIQHIIQPTLIRIINISSYSDPSPSSSSVDSSSSSSLVDSDSDSALNMSFSLFYSIVWLYPIYCLSFILSSLWYQDIALHTFITDGHKSPPKTANMKAWLKAISEEVYRMLLVACFLGQAALVSLVPGPVGSLLFALHMSWLYSLYSFEYHWSLLGWPLEYRIEYFERRAAYFAGFGSPAAALTICFPRFIGAGIFAFAFPIFIILAVIAKPQPQAQAAQNNDGDRQKRMQGGQHATAPAAPSVSQSHSLPPASSLPRVPIFKYSGLVNNAILKFIQNRRT